MVSLESKKPSIINISRFTKDTRELFNRPTNVSIKTPLNKSDVLVSVNSFNQLLKEVVKLSSNLPHHKIALIYKINSESMIQLEIHPVTDAA